MQLLSVDERVLQIDDLSVDEQTLESHAVVVPRVARGALSSERTLLSYGRHRQMAAASDSIGLVAVGRRSTPVGEVTMYDIPAPRRQEGGVAEGTRVGTLTGAHHVAHAFFYRPLNTLDHAVGYFTALAPVDAPKGMTLDGNRFSVLSQRFKVSSEMGDLALENPRGVPAQSRMAVADGYAWQEPAGEGVRTTVVFESPAVRVVVTIPALPGPYARGSSSPGGAAQVVAALGRTIRRTRWA